MRRSNSRFRLRGTPSKSYDYVRQGNVLLPLIWIPHEDYMRLIDDYADGSVQIITPR